MTQPIRENSSVSHPSLAEQAARCRRLSRVTHDRDAAQILERMASDYEDRAHSAGD